jgi:serine/threonine protein kinase/uncharacterized protein HemY
MSNSIPIGRDYRGRYMVRRQLAKGGTSCVYLLHDWRLKRDVALKKGVPSDRYTKDHIRAIFTNEYQILNRLNTPFTPTCYEFVHDDLELYLEYRPGQTLDEYLQKWIKENSFPAEEKLLRLTELILEAVQSCHQAGVVVADLKPRNIQIGRSETEGTFTVTLLDFGSARVIGSSGHGYGADYSVGYGAPELLLGENPTPASDLYSLGAILYALFARREPSLHLGPRDFTDRRCDVHPALQKLVVQLTEEQPARRPSLDEVRAAIRSCAQELAELAQAGDRRCPQCGRPIPDASARFCRYCGASLIRQTRVLSAKQEITSNVDPVTRMLECERAGEYLYALFWAKKALETNRLSLPHQVLALEIALRVPGEFDFATQLAETISLDDLSQGALQRKYLVCLGRVLAGQDPFRPRRELFGRHRKYFEQAVQLWPEEELLWCWLYLASDEPARQEQVLRTGLVHHPDSSRILLYLGRVLHQRGARSEALAIWVEAVQRGERMLSFLQAVYQLAQELKEQKRAEIVGEILLSSQPQSPQEALCLAQFAVERGRAARALELIDQGLAQDPFHRELRRCKAQFLFQQHKYELVLELDWIKAVVDDPFLRTLKGRCLYELRRYAEAAHEMLALINMGHGTVEVWYYLVRCYQRLGKSDHAQQTLSQALRLFPNDESLKRLAGA